MIGAAPSGPESPTASTMPAGTGPPAPADSSIDQRSRSARGWIVASIVAVLTVVVVVAIVLAMFDGAVFGSNASAGCGRG